MIYPLRMVVYFRAMVNFQRVYGEKGSNKPMFSSHGFFGGEGIMYIVGDWAMNPRWFTTPLKQICIAISRHHSRYGSIK